MTPRAPKGPRRAVTCTMCGKRTDDAFESHDRKSYVCTECVCKMYRGWYFERKGHE